MKGRLAGYEWSPDGKKLLLVLADRDPNDPADDAPAGPGGPAAKAPKPIVIDRYKFKQDVVGYLTAPPTRLYLFDVATRKAEALTEAALEASAPAWSADGKWISFTGRSGKDAERYNTGNVFVMEARAGAAPRQVTQYDGVRGSTRGRAEWSPDGSRLVYLQSTGAKQSAYNMTRLAGFRCRGGAPKILGRGALDRGVSAPRFTPDGSIDVFLVADDRSEYSALCGQRRRAAALDQRPAHDFGDGPGKDWRLAVLAASDLRSGEVHALESGELRVPTHHNDSLLAEFQLGATEEFSCKAKDGNEVHGDGEAAGLRGGKEISYAAPHSRRTQRAGRPCVQL